MRLHLLAVFCFLTSVLCHLFSDYWTASTFLAARNMRSVLGK